MSRGDSWSSQPYRDLNHCRVVSTRETNTVGTASARGQARYTIKRFAGLTIKEPRPMQACEAIGFVRLRAHAGQE
jgi:hypothetical protein